MTGFRGPIVTGRIARPRRRLVSGVALGLWLTGVVWLLSHEVFVPQGEFGPSPRSADAWILMLHAAFGFAALWLLGLLWGTHVTAGWAQGRRRGTGGAVFGLASLLVLTAYGLYYCGDETIRPWIATVHWGFGLAAPGAFLLHQSVGRLRAARRRIF